MNSKLIFYVVERFGQKEAWGCVGGAGKEKGGLSGRKIVGEEKMFHFEQLLV